MATFASFGGTSSLRLAFFNPLGETITFAGDSSLDLPTIASDGESFGPITFGNRILVNADNGVYETPGSESALMIFLPRPLALQPFVNREQYRLVVVDMNGTRYGELENAKLAPMTWQLNDLGTFAFDLPTSDPKVGLCMVPRREVQVWKGMTLMWWGVLTTAKGNSNVTSFQAVDLKWYFTRRVMGKVPKTNLLTNGGFEDGLRGWSFSFKPGSIPSAPPAHSITKNSVSGGSALSLGGSNEQRVSVVSLTGDLTFAVDAYVLTAAGTAAVDKFCATLPDAPVIRVEGNTDSVGSTSYNYTLGLNRANSVANRIRAKRPHATVTAVSYGETHPVASNATAAGRAKNRRVDIVTNVTKTAKGHRQYAGQTITFMNPSSSKKIKTLTLVAWYYIDEFHDASKDGWGIYMERRVGTRPKALATSNVTISKDSPRNRWIRMECSLDVPADNITYFIEVRVYPPAGHCIVDEISLTASDELGFFDVDQATIVKKLVEHAQDPAMGKSSLNIGTNCQPTGVKRTREYPFIERQQISEALNEFPTLANGVDIEVMLNQKTGERTLTTFYPQRGGNPQTGKKVAPVLAMGSNIQSYDIDYSGELTSTQVIVQADGEGSAREEGYATDTSFLDGTILEIVYNATPGSAVSSMNAQAQRGLTRYRKAVQAPTLTMMPEFTDELLDRVLPGTVVRVVIKHGWLNLDDYYRVTTVQLDPTTDQLSFTVVPQD